MVSRFRVFAGMLVRRAVTAACSAAFLARAQVHPLRADLYAIFTFAFLGMFDALNGTDMIAR
jgi:hypothetical protein